MRKSLLALPFLAFAPGCVDADAEVTDPLADVDLGKADDPNSNLQRKRIRVDLFDRSYDQFDSLDLKREIEFSDTSIDIDEWKLERVSVRARAEGDDCSDGGGSGGSGGSNLICEATCSYANDGICDDGGPGSEYSLCELGTDCADCGSRTGPGGISGDDSPADTCGLVTLAIDGVAVDSDYADTDWFGGMTLDNFGSNQSSTDDWELEFGSETRIRQLDVNVIEPPSSRRLLETFKVDHGGSRERMWVYQYSAVRRIKVYVDRRDAEVVEALVHLENGETHHVPELEQFIAENDSVTATLPARWQREIERIELRVERRQERRPTIYVYADVVDF